MKKLFALSLLAVAAMVLAPFSISASETDGAIDATYKYAWGENVGWINFACDNCDVHITDTGLSGYVLSETAGWINLDAVENDGEGNLSGYAWGENAGYIKFDPTNGGVVINSSGEFTGSALGENVGWIIFDGDYTVKTDWRSASNRVVSRQGTGSRTRSTASAASAPSSISASSGMSSTLASLAEKAAGLLAFLKFESSEPETPELAAGKPSDALSGEWSVLPQGGIDKFLFASLPPEIQNLTKKFPELAETFKEAGITKVSDLQKLKNAKFKLPGLNADAKLVPAEVVFAKAGDRIDYKVQLTIDERGTPEQSIITIAGKPLDLAIKADKPVDGIKGYVAVKNIERQQAKRMVPADSLLGAAVMSSLGANYRDSEDVKVEEKLVVARFDYSDKDRDGIYTASIASPLIAGEYEIISIIDYKDSKLGKKELRLVTVVDPEGYVYRKSGNEEARISNAVVSLSVKNGGTGGFELWPAKDYQQVNPQKTDKSGMYSFLVPEGAYRLSVMADGYYSFESDEFLVEEGRGVHQNIEMKPKSWWRSLFNLFR